MRGSIAGNLIVVVAVGVLSCGPAFAGSHEGEGQVPEGSGGRKTAPAPAEGSGGKKPPDTRPEDASVEQKTPPPPKREGS